MSASAAALRALHASHGGYLTKRGAIFKTYRKRFFLIHPYPLSPSQPQPPTPAYLYYFADRRHADAGQLARAKGKLSLRGAVLAHDPTTCVGKHQFYFTVSPTNTKRVYLLVAADEAYKRAWICLLRACGCVWLGAGPVPPVPQGERILAIGGVDDEQHDELGDGQQLLQHREDVSGEGAAAPSAAASSEARRTSTVEGARVPSAYDTLQAEDDDDEPGHGALATYQSFGELRDEFNDSETESEGEDEDLELVDELARAAMESRSEWSRPRLAVRRAMDELGDADEVVRLAAESIDWAVVRERTAELRAQAAARDWNGEFQYLAGSPAITPHDQMQIETAMKELLGDFSQVATRLAIVLVDQRALPASVPQEELPIPPVQAGGLAGGTKFRVGNLFFKFASDDAGLYCGRDEWAQKAAKNETRAACAVLEARLPNLHVPMSAVLMVRGHCVLVSAVAPISDDTQVYGSNDAGHTIHDSNAELNALMQRLGEGLNLKEHVVVAGRDGKRVRVWTAADIEGHHGTDGRFYVLDLGRLLPPMSKGTRRVPCAPLIFQFRPEFMRTFCADTPLSSDAFLRWGEDNAAEHNAEVLRAAKLLRDEVLPALAAELREIELGEDFPIWMSSGCATLFHRAGVNLRFLGAVRSLMMPDEARWRRLLLVEMITRCMKRLFQRCLRAMRGSLGERLPTVLAARLARHLFSCGDADASDKLWSTVLPHLLEDKYHVVVSEDELQQVREFLPTSDIALAKLLDEAMFVRWVGDDDQEQMPSVAAMRAWASEREAVGRLDPQADISTTRLPDLVPLDEREQELMRELRIREQRLGPASAKVMDTLLALVALYQFWIDASPHETLAKAQPVLERVLELAGDSNSFAVNEVATFYEHFGDYERAKALRLRYKDMCLRQFGAEHVNVATALGNLGGLYRRVGQLVKAEECYREALAIDLKNSGDKSVEVSTTLNNLGTLLYEGQRMAEAADCFRRAKDIRVAELGVDHPMTLRCSNNLVSVLHFSGDRAHAEPLYREILAARERTLGREHLDTAATLNGLAALLNEDGRAHEAAPLFERALAIMLHQLGPEHMSTIRTSCNYARLLSSMGQLDAAQSTLEDGIRGVLKSVGRTHALLIELLVAIADVHTSKNDTLSAAAYLHSAAHLAHDLLPSDHPLTTSIHTKRASLEVDTAAFQSQEPIELALIRDT